MLAGFDFGRSRPSRPFSVLEDAVREVDFQFFAPVTFFEKADAGQGRTRRIAGVVSTELRDKQRELLIQRGLDFNPFLESGWFNDNHSKATTDVLGYPDKVLKFQKGDTLPDGQKAKFNGTWAEGYLLDTEKANRVWDLAQALAKAGNARRLGFSVEGKVLERTGPDGLTVAKALVRNVAITNAPVGESTRLEALAKSMDEVEKGMTMGAPTPGVHVSAQGPTAGAGAGKVLALQHLELEGEKDPKKVPKDDTVEKSIAVEVLQRRLGCERDQAERAYSALITLKQRGLL